MMNSDQGTSTRNVPRVTVLMTYFAKRDYVEDAIRSVLASTFKDLELLVVDDASTDGGLDLVRAFSDPRIRILESAVNTGRAASANRGYEAARGEYIAILDADDLMGEERLAKQVAYMDSHPEVGALGTYATILGTEENMSSFQLTDSDCRAGFLLGDPFWYGSAMFRSSVLREHGILSDPQWLLPGEDYLFMIKLARHTKIANLPEQLSYYRLGDQNQRHGRDAFADRSALYLEAMRYFGIPADAEKVRLHLMLHRSFRTRPTAQDLRDLRRWMDFLYEVNRKNGLFPIERFEEMMEARWKNLFYYMADVGWSTGFIHMVLSRSFRPDRLYYLLRTRLNSFLRTEVPDRSAKN